MIQKLAKLSFWEICLLLLLCTFVALFRVEIETPPSHLTPAHPGQQSSSSDRVVVQPEQPLPPQQHGNVTQLNRAPAPPAAGVTAIAVNDKDLTLCQYNVVVGRSDHALNTPWKTLVVQGSQGDEFDFDAMCGYQHTLSVFSEEAGNEAMKCKKHNSGVNVLTSLNRMDVPLAYGTCCTVVNYVISQTPLDPVRCGKTKETPEVVKVVEQLQSQDTPVASTDSPAMVIHVLTYLRTNSLNRLLKSLAQSHYDGDVVDLKIMIDLPAGETKHNPSVVKAAEEFSWAFGKKIVHLQPKNVGLYGQWIDSWQPEEKTQTLGALLEDDLEVSPFWYRWTKRAHAAYGHRDDILGYTLQRATLNAAGGASINGGPAGVNNYMYRLIGTWGFIPHPKKWRQFRLWYHRENTNIKPYVPEATVLTGWYMSFEKAHTEKKRMWSLWSLKFAQLCGLSFVYAKCQGSKTLSSNMQEPGNNFDVKGSKDFERLLTEYSELYNFEQAPTILNWDGTPLKSVTFPPDGEVVPAECRGV